MTQNTIAKRELIADNNKWDLTLLFSSDQAWEDAYKTLEIKIKEYDVYPGTLHLSAHHLKEALVFDLSISRDMDHIYTYAHLKNDEDRTNANYMGMYQKAMTLYTKMSEAVSFLLPEIQSIDDATINAFMADPELADYAFHLEKCLRHKPHTLKKETERILAMATEVAHAPSEIFSQLDNADLKFGMIRDENKQEIELSHGNFTTFLMNPQRRIRKKAFFQYYKAYDDHKHTLAQALASSVKKDHFFAQARNFHSCRSASLFANNIPESVYDNLVQTVKANLEPLFTYLNFRKKALKKSELHIYDTYVPITEGINFHMTYEEAVDTCVKALAPLGKEYTDVLAQGLSRGWVDRYENIGKRSGAYSSGCFDSPPYILLNYDPGNINSLYTLIHEAGHSMHSHYAKESQPYHYFEYTIFVAEVASTLNEVLLSHYLLGQYKDNPEMQAYILNREIDNIRATLFRQTMFAEFEAIVHDHAENNIPLTLESMAAECRALLDTWFGSSMVIDKELELEFLRIPHFYSAFYVYKYATGISAAIALANRIIHIGDEATQAYIDFLKLGGSLFPIDELNQAGVDMSTPEPVESAIVHFKNLVNRFMDIYQKLG